jgi:microcystin-dependent protein
MTTGFYPPMPRSPVTELSAGIDAVETDVPVVNAAKLPAAPNVATIGGGEDDSETVKYTGKTGNTLTGCTRGFDPAGSAKAWDSGTAVARVITAQDIEALQDAVAGFEGVPTGVILLWSGAVGDIPSGWALCNGANSTPDLRDRFVVGAGTTYAVGNTGGSATHTLTAAEMPSHTHTNPDTGSGGSHTHDTISNHTHTVLVEAGGSTEMSGGSPFAVALYSLQNKTSSSAGGHTHTNTGTAHTHTVGATGSAGSSNAHENRPPYYALCYIMKT